MTKAHLQTAKQRGDACEMLVAAELTLAGVPATIMPDNWPGYDVIAQPKGGGPAQRISVKARTFKRGAGQWVDYQSDHHFDWLAIVLLPGDDQLSRRFFIIPKSVADARGIRPKAKRAEDKYWQHDKIAALFASFENNFRLLPTGFIPDE